MNKKKQTYSIRGKLVSAACMLLVAIIMVVSSTYAWFTLSTAPEVSGMHTAIGANGALEMALWNGSEPLNTIVGQDQPNTIRNQYWGNLLDLSNGYGLNLITLYPSQLNIEDGVIQGFPLSIPEYGADGRVSNLNAQKTLTGLFDATKGGFFEGDGYGVRAIGAASGKTARQLAYRDAKSQAANATGTARSKASAILNSKGSALANIAISYGMSGDDAEFNATNVQDLRALIDALNGTDGVIANLEKAYKYYIAAIATSGLKVDGTQVLDDTTAMVVYNTATAADKSLNDVVTALGNSGAEMPEVISDAISELNATKAQVTAANAALTTLETALEADPSATFTWGQISGAMTPLASTSAITINGFTAGQVKENLSALIGSVTSEGGLKVVMGTGAGVFADVADHCGDYNAQITIAKVEYNGLVLNNMAARMETKTTVNPQHLTLCSTAADNAGEPAGAGGGDMPFSEFYGYIIDMAFRTNAAESNLLLQTEAKDRIYGDNSNEETMGKGSTMAFSTSDSNFTEAQLRNLMSNMRIVFFSPDTSGVNLGTVLAYAKLDMSKAAYNENSELEAPLVMYKETVTYTADGATCYLKDDVYYTDAECTTPVAAGTTVTATTTVETLTAEDSVIMAMPQNTTVTVSAMVYLDGTNMSNADVSATAPKSMVGKMNLQFSSSANLVPMEYKELHTPAGN